MAIDLPFRRRAVRTLTNEIGCYVLCDLDQVPIYVGQSVDGIRSRVNRHLTSARSDIIANRQIDVWEIAWVWAYPGKDRAEINSLEDALFHEFHGRSALMNGKAPKPPTNQAKSPEPSQRVQVMSDAESRKKKIPRFVCRARLSITVRSSAISLRSRTPGKSRERSRRTSSGFRSITNSSWVWRLRLRAITGRIDRNYRISDAAKT
jgi:GIY-YIG catalytic domain